MKGGDKRTVKEGRNSVSDVSPLEPQFAALGLIFTGKFDKLVRMN